MDEVGTAVLAISLVLIAVFVPTAFIPGISGQFYLQFAITIAVSTAISAFNSLTLSPALAGVLFKPHDHRTPPRFFLARWGSKLADGFNRGFDALAAWLCLARAHSRRLDRWPWSPCSLVFAGLIYATVHMLADGAARLHPDHGPGLCHRRHPTARRRVARAHRRGDPARPPKIIQNTPGVANAVAFAGFSGATFTNASNAGVIFAPFESFEHRLEAGQSAGSIIGTLFGSLQSIQEAFIIALPPPPVPRHRQFRRLQDEAPGTQQRRHAADPGAGAARSPARPTRHRA